MSRSKRAASKVLINYTPTAVCHSFDDTNFAAATYPVPIMVLAQDEGLSDLAEDRLAKLPPPGPIRARFRQRSWPRWLAE